jgi:hypothetical protein
MRELPPYIEPKPLPGRVNPHREAAFYRAQWGETWEITLFCRVALRLLLGVPFNEYRERGR